jgi:D-sedoheptulose 7-phosphate isomerase
MIIENFEAYLSLNNHVSKNVNEDLVDLLIEGFQKIRSSENYLWILGNGGAAGTASHLVTDFSKGSSELGGKPLRAIAVSEMISLVTATANDIGFEDIFSKALSLYAKSGDGVLILSVSGTSPNLIKAHATAKDLGLSTYSILGEKGQMLGKSCDVSIILESGDYQIVENIQLMIGHWVMKRMRIGQCK